MVGRTRWLPALLLGAIGVIGVLGFARQAPSTQSYSQILAGRPECPHDWDFKSQQMPIVGKNIDIPEFNDCQRFILTEHKWQYGGLFAIFAADTLAKLEVLPLHRWVAVAEIYAEGEYTPLGIEGPYSCLFLYYEGRVTFRAKMVRVASAEVDCDHINVDSAVGKPLNAFAVTDPRFAWEDYPPVARWDWSDSTSKQYIGVKCGAAWCEVGDRDLPQPPPPPPSAPRTVAIKGWYDEQLLAVQAPNGQLIPGRLIRGTIFPDTALDGMRGAAAFRNGWHKVAYVALDTLSGVGQRAIHQYKRTLNLDARPRIAFGPPPPQFNTIELCHGNITDMPNPCPMPGVRLDTLVASCKDDGLWWSRVTSAIHGDVAYYCVTRRDHSRQTSTSEFHIPGTARWRWMANDEKAWNACLEGCCETGAN